MFEEGFLGQRFSATVQSLHAESGVARVCFDELLADEEAGGGKLVEDKPFALLRPKPPQETASLHRAEWLASLHEGSLLDAYVQARSPTRPNPNPNPSPAPTPTPTPTPNPNPNPYPNPRTRGGRRRTRAQSACCKATTRRTFTSWSSTAFPSATSVATRRFGRGGSSSIATTAPTTGRPQTRRSRMLYRLVLHPWTLGHDLLSGTPLAHPSTCRLGFGGVCPCHRSLV